MPPVGHAADRLDLAASSADPYRGGLAPTLRYVCIVCDRSASDLPGTCEHDGVPLLDLEEAEVVAEVRARAQTVCDRKRRRAIGAITAASIVLSVAGFGALLWTGVCDLDTRPFHGRSDFLPLLLMMVVWWALLLWLYPLVFKRSILATKFDPAAAPLREVLVWLGVRFKT